MGDSGQISKRSISHLDDGSVSSSSYSSTAPSGLRKFRNFCGALVNQPRVQICIVALIAINALMMGLATFDFVTNSHDATRAFDVIDQLFLIIFTIEIGLQVIYHGIWRVLTDGWLCFDFVVVVGSWSWSSAQIFRSFRIFRAFRLVARLDTLKKLVQALIDVAPSVGVILALLALVTYIFAVMCTILFDDLFADGIVDEDYFGRLDYTFFSKSCKVLSSVIDLTWFYLQTALFQFMTLSWADVTRQVAVKHVWAWSLITTFVFVTSFILFSLVVAVVCDAVMQGERGDMIGEKELRVRIRLLRRNIRKLTERQDKLKRLAVKTCSHVGIDSVSFVGMSTNNRTPKRVSSCDASACSTAGSLRNEQWFGAFVDASDGSGYGDPANVSTLELTIQRKTRKESS
jgi:Ion transport protein